MREDHEHRGRGRDGQIGDPARRLKERRDIQHDDDQLAARVEAVDDGIAREELAESYIRYHPLSLPIYSIIASRTPSTV